MSKKYNGYKKYRAKFLATAFTASVFGVGGASFPVTAQDPLFNTAENTTINFEDTIFPHEVEEHKYNKASGVFSKLDWDQDKWRDYGDDLMLGVPAIAWGISKAKGDHDGATRLLESCAVSAGAVQILKHAFNKTILGERPTGGDLSFPSGHTISAICGSAYLQSRYGEEYGIPSALLATHVGASRVFRTDNDTDSPHHVRDVMFSVILGYAVSEWMVEPHDPEKRGDPALQSQDYRSAIAVPMVQYSRTFNGYGIKRQDPLDMTVEITRSRTVGAGDNFGIRAKFEYRF